MGNSSLSKREKYAEKYFEKIVDKERYKDLKLDPEYENLILSGGGDRAHAFIGTVKVSSTGFSFCVSFLSNILGKKGSNMTERPWWWRSVVEGWDVRPTGSKDPIFESRLVY
jgi:hypothetical protein